MPSNRPFVLIALAIAACIAAFSHLYGTTSLGNDGAQYLTGARFLRSDLSYSTDILYFDDQYSFGKFPAAQTVWPPGPSISIALLSFSGMPIEFAGRVLGSIAYLCMIAFVAIMIRSLGLRASASIAAMLWVLSITFFWNFSSVTSSDMPFIAAMTAAVCLIVYRLNATNAPDPTRILTFDTYAWVSAIAGLSFLFRYAGVFVIAWCFALIGIEFLYRLARGARPISTIFWKSFGAAIPGIAVFITVAFRNYVWTGGIKGYEKQAQNSLVGLLEKAGESIVTILTGITDYSDALQPSLFALIAGGSLLVILLACFFVVLGFWKIVRNPPDFDRRAYSIVAIASLAGIYLIGFLALGVNTLVVLDSRYLLPIAPLFVVIAIAMMPKGRVLVPTCVAIVCVTQMMHLEVAESHSSAAQHMRYAELRDWIDSNTLPEDPIIATGDGQLLGYFAGRKTFAIPIISYTDVTWDSSSIRQLAVDNDVSYIVAGRYDEPRQFTNQVADLMQGRPWQWLEPVATFQSAYVYKITYR